MSGARALLPDPPTTDVASADADSRYLRLSSCPRCAGRRRTLVEVGGRLVGRCLGCGEELAGPLQTEWQSQILVVGRAMPVLHTIDSGD
jgi:hypothetical protein